MPAGKSVACPARPPAPPGPSLPSAWLLPTDNNVAPAIKRWLCGVTERPGRCSQSEYLFAKATSSARSAYKINKIYAATHYCLVFCCSLPLSLLLLLLLLSLLLFYLKYDKSSTASRGGRGQQQRLRQLHHTAGNSFCGTDKFVDHKNASQIMNTLRNRIAIDYEYLNCYGGVFIYDSFWAWLH